MPVTLRSYDRQSDFDRVGCFLVETYRTSGSHINWLQPWWEYKHFHPLVQNVDLGSIGVWELDGNVVGVVHPEHEMGGAYFEIHPEFQHLKVEMLAHVEEKISVKTEKSQHLNVWIGESDHQFQKIAANGGYRRADRVDPMSFVSTEDLPAAPVLPEGFGIQSLATEDDPHKVHRLLWRGFGHGEEPEDDTAMGRNLMGAEGRRLMQSAPNFRKDLNIVTVAPDGNFVTYCGMWIEPVHRIAYVEPVATDPDFRRMGLGKAAVFEGIRRCSNEGAIAACVGSTMPFYRSMGFDRTYASELWSREW